MSAFRASSERLLVPLGLLLGQICRPMDLKVASIGPKKLLSFRTARVRNKPHEPLEALILDTLRLQGCPKAPRYNPER